ncbi:Uncharacterised protein [Mycobacteroides abscessus subsp. massiliense]|nr:Uncharacterised protein [Mycobacteroides abscessus subsp. massiliense]
MEDAEARSWEALKNLPWSPVSQPRLAPRRARHQTRQADQSWCLPLSKKPRSLGRDRRNR